MKINALEQFKRDVIHMTTLIAEYTDKAEDLRRQAARYERAVEEAKQRKQGMLDMIKQLEEGK